MPFLPRYRKEHPVFTTAEAAVAGDRVQQLHAEARRAGQARVLRAARRSARRAAR
jgi:hypothetical protein